MRRGIFCVLLAYVCICFPFIDIEILVYARANLPNLESGAAAVGVSLGPLPPLRLPSAPLSRNMRVTTAVSWECKAWDVREDDRPTLALYLFFSQPSCRTSAKWSHGLVGLAPRRLPRLKISRVRMSRGGVGCWSLRGRQASKRTSVDSAARNAASFVVSFFQWRLPLALPAEALVGPRRFDTGRQQQRPSLSFLPHHRVSPSLPTPFVSFGKPRFVIPVLFLRASSYSLICVCIIIPIVPSDWPNVHCDIFKWDYNSAFIDGNKGNVRLSTSTVSV